LVKGREECELKSVFKCQKRRKKRRGLHLLYSMVIICKPCQSKNGNRADKEREKNDLAMRMSTIIQ